MNIFFEQYEEELEKVSSLLGAGAGYMAQGPYPEASERSGFWRGLGGGMAGQIAGNAAGYALGHPGVGHLLGVAGDIGGGYLAGRTAAPTPEELERYLAKKRLAKK